MMKSASSLSLLLQRKPPLAVSGCKKRYRLSLRSSIRENFGRRVAVCGRSPLKDKSVCCIYTCRNLGGTAVFIRPIFIGRIFYMFFNFLIYNERTENERKA